MSFVIGLVVSLLIGAVILAIALWIVDLLPAIPANIKQFIRIIILILFALWLIGVLIGMPVPSYHYR